MPKGFCTWGIQTGPFAACRDDFVPPKFSLSYLYTRDSHFLLPQRAENEKNGFTQNWMRHRGFCTWGIQTGPLAACGEVLVQKFLHLQIFILGTPISYYPRELKMRQMDSLKIG